MSPNRTQQELTMARPNVNRMRAVTIDGVITHVQEDSTIADVVDAEVESIHPIDLDTGKSNVIRRHEFARRVPESFTTDLTAIEKG